MNRRGFFGRLVGAFVAAKVAPALPQAAAPAVLGPPNGIRGLVDNGTEMAQIYFYHRPTGARSGFTPETPPARPGCGDPGQVERISLNPDPVSS